MDILSIDQLGIITIIKNSLEDTSRVYLKINKGKYTYKFIKNKEGVPLKFKICDNLINFSGFIIKTNKITDKVIDIKIEDIVDTDYMIKQDTFYDSDDSSDIEYDICDQLIDSIC